MMKLGCFAVMKDDSGRFVDIESFVRFAHELKLDMVEFHLRKGFLSKDPDYLRRIKIQCLKYGLPIGYLGSGGHFAGTDEEVRTRMEQARARPYPDSSSVFSMVSPSPWSPVQQARPCSWLANHI